MPGTPAFDGLTVGDIVAEESFPLTRDSLVRYAGASGDFNAIHYRDDIARSVGLPGVLAHGMLTMGLGAGFVSTWSGDPGAVTRYGVRLSTYTIVGREGGQVEYTGRVKSLDPETRTAVIAIVAKSGGRKIFGLATANLRFR